MLNVIDQNHNGTANKQCEDEKKHFDTSPPNHSNNSTMWIQAVSSGKSYAGCTALMASRVKHFHQEKKLIDYKCNCMR